ncbi:TPA: hypothetical protein DD449_04225 [Candidatus Berkelbacteria bacterium]|uniref:NlpC/P60 domain-containing protein n=1 Tax=Berkelbacteria bacterium GW2011_GWE1_39_12 TaxID=1618337 RepID=A0A0G4B2V9_9BACT|nr:MAG: hypothetical protein UT28_C0001G0466 [Berkelbacteria bacterium GW2011_GWE1_39_12]HBO60861.1 hypothetical protein [Candidatus Berkelbacteria bacterium]
MNKIKLKIHYDRGVVWILIAVVAMAFILIIMMVTAAAMIGDRTGSGSGSSSPGGSSEETDAPIVAGGCSDVITAARTYLNKGIRYSQEGGRCGPANSKGAAGVTYMDCTGYASRVYRDAGLLPMNTCLYTVSFASSSSFQRIATTQAQAKTLWQPGDFLLFGMGSASGPAKKTPFSHIVLFGGESGTKQIIYESGGSGGGPHVSTYNVFGGGRGSRFYGLYRPTRDCASSTET